MDLSGLAAPRIVIITGMPGAGKTTVFRLVAEALPRAARVSGDIANSMILNGFVWALGEPADEAAKQVELCHQNIASLANNFADAGFTAIIETVLDDRRTLNQVLDRIAPRKALLVVLAPGEERCRTRNADRDADEKFEFEGYATLDASMRSGFGSLGWWLDTAQLSAAETAELIVQQAGDRGRLQ